MASNSVFGRLRLRLSARRWQAAALAALPFAIIGLALLLHSRAATSSVPQEAESGTLAGSYQQISDQKASGGSYILFGGGNGGGGGGISDVDLNSPVKKEIAMELVSSAENSSLDWKAQYGYIQWNVEGNSTENRGYTAGIIGFCSGCGDMTKLIQHYNELVPGNGLSKYLPAIQQQEQLGQGHVTQGGLGQAFIDDWKTAATDSKFQQAQNDERDSEYFNPAFIQAKQDGLRALGQFIYYDAIVVHGPGSDAMSFGGIRAAALKKAKPPIDGGDETAYLNAFMDARIVVMQQEQAHQDVSRIEDAQRVFLKAGNVNLDPPLHWKTYGDPYSIDSNPTP